MVRYIENDKINIYGKCQVSTVICFWITRNKKIAA